MKKRLIALLLTAALAVQGMSMAAYADPVDEAPAAAEDGDAREDSAGAAEEIATDVTTDIAEDEYDPEMDPRGTSFTAGGLTFLVTDWETAELQAASAPAEDYVIPSEAEDPFGNVYTVTSVSGNALAGAAAVKKLTIPSTVTHVNTEGAMLSDLEEIVLQGENTSLFLDKGVLFEKTEAGSALVLYPSGSGTLHYAIPKGTTEIRTHAFYGAKNLLTVIIPDSVKKIEKEALTAFANPLDVAFNMDEAPDEVASEAFSLTDAAPNTFYFKNEKVLEDIQSETPDFTGETDVEFVTDGLPEGILAVLEEEGDDVLNGVAGEDATIEEGWYYFESDLSTDVKSYALDIEEAVGSMTQDANLDIYTFDKTKPQDAQLFQIKLADAEKKSYTIIPYGSQIRALDCATGATTAGTNVRQHKQNGTPAQAFRFVTTDVEGVYQIQPQDDKTCLTVKGDTASDGANVELGTWSDKGGQNWELIKAPNPTAKQDANIKEGWYIITTALDSGFALDINGGVKSDAQDANLDIFAYDAANELVSQMFYVKKEDTANNAYTFMPFAARNRVLDCLSGYYTPGTNLRQHKANGTDAQKFQILKTDETGKYQIKNINANTCFTVKGGSASNKANVELGLWANTDAQKWSFVESSHNTKPTNLARGIYVLHTAIGASNSSDFSTRAMAVANDSGANKTNIQINSPNGSDRQKFMLIPLGNSKYYIVNAITYKSIDVESGVAAHKTNVQLYRKNDTAAQTWTIRQDNQGFYRITSSLVANNGTTALNLDVNQGVSKDGQNVQVGRDNYDSRAQDWIIEKSNITSISNGTYEIATALKNDRSVVFDLPMRSSAAGVQYQIFTKKDISSQKFNVTKSGSKYIIKNIKSDAYIGLDKLGVVQLTKDSSKAYQWTIEATGDAEGTFFMKSSDGLYVTVNGGKPTNGALLALGGSPTTATKWYFTKSQIANGWQVVADKTYYYSNGSPLKSSYIGNAFVDKNGVLWTGWHKAYTSKPGGPFTEGYYYYWDGKNGGVTDIRPLMLSSGKWKMRNRTVRINTSGGYTDKTFSGPDAPFALYIDTVNCFILVYTMYPGTQAYNTPVFAFKISPGLYPNLTNPGITQTKAQSNWTELMGPSYGQYTTLINYADGEYIHSVACGQRNTHNVDPGAYNLLGQRASHGCMRTCVRNAFWIYCYVRGGSYVNISDKGHKLTTSLIPQPKMYGGTSIDPTDPLYTGNYSFVDNGKYYGSYYF